MKRIISIAILIVSAIILVSCSNTSQNPILLKETNAKGNIDEEKLDFEIDKIVLSKGYQVLEPNVKLVKKDIDYKLIASMGLVNSSGADITKIIKSGNEIDIYIKNKGNRRRSELVVPQISIDLISSNIKDIDNIDFNIINENYEPIDIIVDANEAINKVSSGYGISTMTLPDIKISNDKDGLFWHLKYKNIFDKYNKETPLVNLDIEIDTNTGEILKSSKTFVSSYIDEGHILDYVLDKYILYKKNSLSEENGIFKEELWLFDLETKDKKLLYSSENMIHSASFSPDFKNIGILEAVDDIKNLYIVGIDERKSYKILFENETNPQIAKWKDNENIYIVDNRVSNSIIYNYNLKNNSKTIIARKKENIIGLKVLDENILVSKLEDDEVKSFYITNDFKNSVFQRSNANPQFISPNFLGYVEKVEAENKNILYIYDLKQDILYDTLNLNICNIYLIDDDNLFIIEKNQNTNDYTLYNYDTKGKNLSQITHLNSSNIYLNEDKNIIYLDSTLPYEKEKTQIIYSLDLNLIN